MGFSAQELTVSFSALFKNDLWMPRLKMTDRQMEKIDG